MTTRGTFAARALAFTLALVLAASSPGAPAPASTPLYGAVAPQTTVEAGLPAEICIAALNRSATTVAVNFPPTASGEIVSMGKSWPVTLHAVESAPEAARTIAPDTFGLSRWRLTLPPDVPPSEAVLEIRLEGVDTLGSVIAIGAAASPSRACTESPSGPATSFVRTQPGEAALRRTFANHLSPHEPIYFIYGSGAHGAKFQFPAS